MRNGDLSSDPVPRYALVFEGALGWPPEDKKREFDRLMRRRRYTEAAAMLELNARMCTVIWDRAWRMHSVIDIVTYLGPEEWADALSVRLRDEEELPVHRVWSTTPQLLGRKLSYMPDLVRVYDPYPDHLLCLGSKGRTITDANQLGY